MHLAWHNVCFIRQIDCLVVCISLLHLTSSTCVIVYELLLFDAVRYSTLTLVSLVNNYFSYMNIFVLSFEGLYVIVSFWWPTINKLLVFNQNIVK